MTALASYTRETDGAEMVAIAPGVFVNVALLRRLKLTPHREETSR